MTTYDLLLKNGMVIGGQKTTHYAADIAIKGGKIAKDWNAYQLKVRPDILSYEWFFLEEDKSLALIMDIYENSDAMMATYKALDESDEHSEETDYPYGIIKLRCTERSQKNLRT